MQIEVGEVYTGKVTGITKFGAFVDFAENKRGMVHISEIASSFVKEIRDVVSEGQEVKVKLVSISPEGKIALSMKKVEEKKEQTKSFDSYKKERQEPRYKEKVLNFSESQWQAQPQGDKFEDMMSKFKKRSEEKMSDLKRITDTKRGGHSRRDK